MATRNLTTGNDFVVIFQGGANIGGGTKTSFIGDLVDALGGSDTIVVDDRYPSGHYSLSAAADGILTMTTASGAMKFKNFESIQFQNVTVKLGTAANDSIIGTTKADTFPVWPERQRHDRRQGWCR